MIEAKIIRDSISNDTRLTTFVLTYPRFIHSEFMTHRMFSRNASSSRAIPVKKSIQMVRDNPVIPLAFTRNKAGMQGGEALSGEIEQKALLQWMDACYVACEKAEALADLEVHKQYANRILEPFSHITVVCSATDYANFFALRYHPMAQPEIAQLAKQMWEAYSVNIPDKLEEGQWHLPFISDEDLALVANEVGQQVDFIPYLIKMSVARCARVSYLNHEGKKPSLEEDLKLYDRLVGSAPIHASPAEHQAQVSFLSMRSGNFGEGWVQYRKTLEGENIQVFNGPEEE